ncbi:glycosyltransferase [Agrococcus sp. HG114]|uniref:rhamnosyltransferase WsaF family glycosyltransferase n=1 Tax=Agrococcus sp. HG114 TaxID=2969757 RepID=UPI00215A2B51|nr:glycosyltransferase [Agrococcus sp. HG114]MCR8670425.1 glycosyltransferase [Agrococcus sp. HG114]
MSLRRNLGQLARRALPAGSRGRHAALVAVRTAKAARHEFIAASRSDAGGYVHRSKAVVGYDEWLAGHRDGFPSLEGVEPRAVAVVVEVPHGERLDAGTARSVRGQKRSSPQLIEVASGTRIEDVPLPERGFALFLRNGDRLDPSALAVLAREHAIDPSRRLITFDRDHLAGGKREQPVFLPEHAPEMLLGANHVDRAFAVDTAHVGTGWTVDDSGVWRFLLARDFQSWEWMRVPFVLLSVARDARRPSAEDAAMVAAVLAARGERATAEVHGSVVRVRFEPAAWPKVSIVIPTRHNRANLERLMPTLARTDYPEFDVTIFDNGDETPEHRAFYEAWGESLALRVEWYATDSFNYSKVMNRAVASTDGELVLTLNDDTEAVDAGWLREMVGHLLREGIGTVGVQHRFADGRIQHGGVTLGPNGFADNTFTGMRPGEATMLGSTDLYRDSLAVTGACTLIRREHWDEVGGMDENFILTGSDVVLGLDQHLRERRNVVLPFDLVRHHESVTRGTSAIPESDFFASYWRYHSWLSGEDPFWSPNLSRASAVPRLRPHDEASPIRYTFQALGRPWGEVKQTMGISDEAKSLLDTASVSREQVDAVRALHEAEAGRLEIRSINWFIPDIDMPYFGGLNTCFRLAAKLHRDHGVHNRFIVFGSPMKHWVSTAVAAAFPELREADVHYYQGLDEQLDAIPEADAGVATLWLTAMHLAKASGMRRKFYLVQDYEPGFYPASSMFAMTEESYRLGLYGLCNTRSMHEIYRDLYDGESTWFAPAVDRSIFHAEGRREKGADEPVTIFAYARDHFRNCWELAYEALRRIKRIHGDGVRIIAAGARYLPPTADFVDMGLMDYRATGAMYRETDIGLTLQISRHPSYLPLEIMASGATMVAPDSKFFKWLFTEDNSSEAMRTVDDIVAQLDGLVRDAALRRRKQQAALATIDTGHGSWDAALSGIYDYMCDPRGEHAAVE